MNKMTISLSLFLAFHVLPGLENVGCLPSVAIRRDKSLFFHLFISFCAVDVVGLQKVAILRDISFIFLSQIMLWGCKRMAVCPRWQSAEINEAG